LGKFDCLKKKYLFILGGWFHFLHQTEGSVCGTVDKATV